MAQQKARNLKFDIADTAANDTSAFSQSNWQDYGSESFTADFIDLKSDNTDFVSNANAQDFLSDVVMAVPLSVPLFLQLAAVSLGLFYLSFAPAIFIVFFTSSFLLLHAVHKESFLIKLQAVGSLALAFIATLMFWQAHSANLITDAKWQNFLFGSFATLISLSYLLSKLAREWLLDDCLLITHHSDDEAVLLDPNLAFTEKKILVSSIKAADIIRYYSDEIVYADGVVLSGVAEVEQRLASGQSRYCIKGKGDPIFAGSSIVSGTVDVKVELPPEQSNFIRAIELIKTEISKLDYLVNRNQNAPRFLAGLSPHVVLCFVAILSSVTWAVVFNNWPLGLWCAASVMSLSVLVEFVMKLKPILLRHLLISAFSKGVLVNEFLPIYKSSIISDKIACLGVNAIDVTTAGKDNEISVTNFEVIDDRVDGQTLRSVVVSILGRSEAAVHLNIAETIRAQLQNFRLYEMSSANAEDDAAGVADAVEAVVEGITFRMGSEEWLISKGVMIQPNELLGVKPNTSPYIIAMGNEVVAMATLTIPLDANATKLKKLTDLVKSHQIRTVLLDSDSNKDLTVSAKQAGIELEDIFPVNSDEAIINRLSHISPVTLIAPYGTSSLIEAAASVVARPYQFYEHVNLRPMSFGFLSSAPSTVGWFLLAIRKCQRLIDFQQATTRFFTLFVAIFAASGLLTPPLVVTSAIILGLFLFLRR